MLGGRTWKNSRFSRMADCKNGSLMKKIISVTRGSITNLPWARVDIGVGRDLPAVSVWGLSLQVLEQLGFRKIVDASFIIAFIFPAGVDPADIQKYMNGMRRAQMDLDREPEKYRHFYLNEIPDRYKSMVDVCRFSPGECIVFLPYTEAMYARTQAWIHERGLFEGQAPAVDYAACVTA
jgi:NitT/TauT family transport system substrate-binding protein